MSNSMKKFANIIGTLAVMTGLSFGSYQACSWYGCDSWVSFMRADLICNACVDASYHLKNYQLSLYGATFTLITYKMSSLVERASSSTDSYIFEDYSLGRKTPPSLRPVATSKTQTS